MTLSWGVIIAVIVLVGLSRVFWRIRTGNWHGPPRNRR